MSAAESWLRGCGAEAPAAVMEPICGTSGAAAALAGAEGTGVQPGFPPPALPLSLPPLPAQHCIISPRRSFACKHNQENIIAPFQALSDTAFLKRPVLSVCPPTSL